VLCCVANPLLLLLLLQLLPAVAKKGYAQTSPTVATPCGNSSYAPQYNRLSKCLRCQSGLEESPQSMLLDGERDSKRTVCSEWHEYILGANEGGGWLKLGSG
jgi:hypothetical protein